MALTPLAKGLIVVVVVAAVGAGVNFGLQAYKDKDEASQLPQATLSAPVVTTSVAPNAALDGAPAARQRAAQAASAAVNSFQSQNTPASAVEEPNELPPDQQAQNDGQSNAAPTPGPGAIDDSAIGIMAKMHHLDAKKN